MNIGTRALGAAWAGRDHSALRPPRRGRSLGRLGMSLALLMMALPDTGLAVDPKRFLDFDARELRAVETRLSELIEPGTTRLLREPETEVERYVVERQLRLHAEFSRGPIETRLEDGTIVLEHPAMTTTATRVYTNAAGLPVLECAQADASTLGFAPHLLKRRPDSQRAR